MDSGQKKDGGDVVRQGCFKKLNNMKKKYFVLKSESLQNSARLEYYETEKKWKSGGKAKRVISLKSCFNIVRRLDTRQKHVIAFYTKDDCVGIVLDSEEELASWLQAIMSLLHGDNPEDDQPHSRQHVWQVNVQKKGLGASRNILGLYNLCLTDKKLYLVKIRPNANDHIPYDPIVDPLEFSLPCIRRCGDSECFFYMEVGRLSATGAGELWMHTEDSNIAKSMHATILNAMSSRSLAKEDLVPKTRNRSSSANEASKPISVLTRRQTHTGSKSHGLSPSSESTFCGGRSCVGSCISPCVTASAAYCASQDTDMTLKEQTKIKEEDSCNSVVDNTVGSISSMMGVRERCDSLPSRGNAVVTVPRASAPMGTPRYSSALRPHSMFVHGVGQSPPIMTNSPLSPNSGACSTDSAGSSMSIDETDNFFHHSTTPDEMSHLVGMIPEEVGDETHGIWQSEKCDTINEDKIEIENDSKDMILRKPHMVGSYDSSSPVPIMGTPVSSGEYMPMSPASVEPLKLAHSLSNSTNHSRTSSVTEEMSNFVEINLVLPSSNAESRGVDIVPSKNVVDHTMSPTGSFCSVTSSVPSNDLRFTEFHLEKVSSYFTPNEDKENRPARAYSVGSRPEHTTRIITRPDLLSNTSGATEAARARAFSVGSRSKVQKDNRILHHGTPPHCHLHHLNNSSHSGNKSSSAPLLVGISHVNSSTCYLYNSNHSSAEPLDMMEMDFSNRSSSSVKTNYVPDAKTHNSSIKASSGLSALKSNTQPLNKNPSEGYLFMTPSSGSKSGYVEMKPVELVNSSYMATKTVPNAIRKVSISKSPPSSNDLFLSKPISNLSEDYVEMSLNNSKTPGGKSQKQNRVSSSPIAINSSNVKDTLTSNPTASSSTSPIFTSSLTKKSEENLVEVNFYKGASPKASPGISPIIPTNPSPFSSLRRHSRKHQMRRNSKELSAPGTPQSPTLLFNLTSPISPVKPVAQSVTSNVEELPEKMCSTDPSCSNRKILNKVDHEALAKMLSDCSFADESVSEYMEMNPGGLTTVKEINESNLNKIGVDKDTKQLINNATKEFDVTSKDLSEYITLNPSAQLKSRGLWLKRQKSVDDAVPNNNPSLISDNSSLRSKLVQPSQPITTPKSQNIFRKTSVPPIMTCNLNFRPTDANIKEQQSILSSNPLAAKTIIPNFMTKSNVNISNINQVQNVRKPVLVTITGQSQPTSANFKPISAIEFSEPRSAKSGSPKPLESVLNRQVMGSYCVTNDGYEMLVAQNGKQSSRPNSVNKSKKGNDCSNSRPPSVTSQGEISGGNGSRSRPSSVSSEMSSTPTNSRPASVTGEREGSSRGLHYASLELENVPDRSPRPPPTPVANRQTFSYAQIDFVKSEELKNSKNLSNKTKN